MNRTAATIAIPLGVLAAVLLGIGDRPPAAPAPARPNIVLVVMDTTRPDRTSLYGYARDTTPFLRELSRRACTFDRAYSTSSWTLPAHASLFTGLYPIAHQATQETRALAPQLTTLAEILGAHGYDTIAVVENPMLTASYHFDQGFARYHEMWRVPAAADRDPTLERLEQELKERPGDRPFFLFVNLIAPHSPYDSARQFQAGYVTQPGLQLVHNGWRAHLLGRARLTAAQLRHLGELYDAEIRYTDHQIGALAASLQAHGLWDDTVLAITSDHGENLGEHGLVDHVFSLHETLIRAVLVLHYPPAAPPGTRDARAAQILDLFPTLLRLAGVTEPPPHQGLDLLAAPPAGPRPLLCEYYHPDQVLKMLGEDADSPLIAPYRRRLRALIVGSDKLIWGSDGRHALHDLAADPGELEDLQADHEERRLALEARLEELLAGLAAPATGAQPGEIDAATRRALQELGYLK